MLNLNQLIKIFFVVLFLLFYTTNSCLCQTSQFLPQELQSLSTNFKAIEKVFDFEVTSNISKTSQNLSLNKIGKFLQVIPSSKIKNEAIKLKLFSTDGAEAESYLLKDNSFLFITDPEKTYFLAQESEPSCSSLARIFKADSSTVICPSVILTKLQENIKPQADTVLSVNPLSPVEYYSIKIQLPEDKSQLKDFIPVKITSPAESSLSTNQSLSNEVNIGNLLSISKLCLIQTISMNFPENNLDCTLNPQIKNVVIYSSDLSKISSIQDPVLIYPSYEKPQEVKFDYILRHEGELASKDKPTEINNKSVKKYFFDNYKLILGINLGTLNTFKTKINRRAFSLNNPINISKSIKGASLEIPSSSIGVITTPFTDKSTQAFLRSLNISNKNKSGLFSFSTTNNILIKNLIEESDDGNTLNQSASNKNNLIISTFLPDDITELDITKTYTALETSTGASSDENGNVIQVINDKAKAELLISKKIKGFDLKKPILLQTEPSSTTFANVLFSNQTPLSGFIIPPDSRPVVEDGYRATAEFSMIINIDPQTNINIKYFELKTKDESKLVNFFKFNFLPIGTYSVKLRFDGDRKKLLQNLGLIQKEADDNI